MSLSKAIGRWLYDEVQTDKRLKNVEVGTVHSFQGGEADVVILDLVDGPPRPTIGALLRDDTGMRLMNVAITRARGKLIIIAHKDWLRGTDPARAGLLWNVLFGGNSPKPCYVLPLAQSNITENREVLTESPKKFSSRNYDEGQLIFPTSLCNIVFIMKANASLLELT